MQDSFRFLTVGPCCLKTVSIKGSPSSTCGQSKHSDHNEPLVQSNKQPSHANKNGSLGSMPRSQKMYVCIFTKRIQSESYENANI